MITRLAFQSMSKPSRKWIRRFALLGLAGSLAGVLGCSARDSKWESQSWNAFPVGLQGSVVLQDEALQRLIFLTSSKELGLSTHIFPTRNNVTEVIASQDKSRLFVLSKGDYPRLKETDDSPRLVVFSGGTTPKIVDEFPLDNPMGKLALDPQGKWVVAYGGDATVTNPNELVLLLLDKKSKSPVSKTIRSFGGAPEEIIFTDELTVPGGSARRFMVVRTDRDITLVDLSDLEKDEITIRLPKKDDGNSFSPLQVVFSEGDPEITSDSRLAVRLDKSSDVVLIELGPSETKGKDFAVIVNIANVRGIPSTIDFVETDGGLRVAALVPSKLKAALIDPQTSRTSFVDLPFAFSQMTRITDSFGGAAANGDVALLYGTARQIAFWSLNKAIASPYRSVSSTELAIEVTEVLDVPVPNEHLKVLIGSEESSFFVLDLEKNESFPFHLKNGVSKVQVSLDGQRVWVNGTSNSNFSALRLNDLHPQALYVNPGVSELFDIEQAQGEGRAAVAFHDFDAWSATVLNAKNPKSHQTAYYPSLQLEGVQ